MVGEHDVAERDADLEARPFLDRQAERERQRVGGVPGDLGDVDRGVDRRLVEQPARRIAAIGCTSVSRTAQRCVRSASSATKVVGLTTSSNTRTSPALSSRDVRRAAWRGSCRAAGSSRCRPRCRSDSRFRRSSSSASCAVSNTCAPADSASRSSWLPGAITVASRGRPASAAACPRRAATAWPTTSKCTQARALQPSCMQVVDQPRVAAHRHALARGGEVGLVGDRVLPIREVVGGVGQQLDQHDAEVGRPSARSSPGTSRLSRSSIRRRKPW